MITTGGTIASIPSDNGLIPEISGKEIISLMSELKNICTIDTLELLNIDNNAEKSSDIRKRVIKARQIQAERYKNENILTNSELTSELIKKYCKIDEASQAIFKTAIVKYQLSGRRYDRILKLARTIADLDNSRDIQQSHLMQALQYKMFDPKYSDQ